MSELDYYNCDGGCERSHLPNDLAIYQNHLFCSECFNYSDIPESLNFCDLERFVPQKDKRIAELEAQLNIALDLIDFELITEYEDRISKFEESK